MSIVPGTVTNIPSGGRCISFVPNTDLNKKFIMKVTVDGGSNCSGGNVTKEFPFSWGDIAGNPGTVLIEGPTSPYVGMSASYYVNGSCLINPKNKFTWQYALSQGSFTFGNYVSGGGSNIPVTNTSQLSLNVNWTGISCGNGAFGQYGCNYCPCYTLSIGGFSHNDCSSNQSWGFASVKVYQ